MREMSPCRLCGHTFDAHHDHPSWDLPVTQMRCRDCPGQICAEDYRNG